MPSAAPRMRSQSHRQVRKSVLSPTSHSSAQQTFNRGAAVPEHERRPGTGVFRGWPDRKHDNGSIALPRYLRYRTEYSFHLQRKNDCVAYSLTRQLNKAELERGQRERSSNPDSVDLVLRARASELRGTH